MKNFIFTNIFKDRKSRNDIKLGLWAEKELVNINNINKHHYRWDNPIVFKNDVSKIKKHYSKYLSELSHSLNIYHGENYPIKYWEIIIGPWLHIFLSVIYERYHTLQDFLKINKDIKSSSFLAFENVNQRPKNTDQFLILAQTDLWNQFIYQKIAENSFNFKNLEINYINDSQSNFIDKKIFFIYSNRKPKLFGELFTKIIFNISIKYRKINYFFFVSGFSKRLNIFLFAKLKNMVSTSLFDFDISKNNQNRNFKFINKKRNQTEFENICRSMINDLIPESFVESYLAISKKLNKTYKFKPKVIFTTFGYKIYDCFKIWTAKKIHHNNSKLIVYQHGNFGTYENCLDEDHQISIANMYLSWGWKYSNKKQMKPFYAPFYYKKNETHTKVNKIFMVTAIKSKYTNSLYTGHQSSGWAKYIVFLDLFLKSTSTNIKSNLVIKGYHHDYGWDYTQILKKKHSKISIYDGNKTFGDLANIYKLNIITYNGTALLQSLSSGTPTLILWDSTVWRNSSISKRYFKLLSDSHILFDDVVKASNHITKIYDDINSWWNNKELQNNLNMFIKYFSRNTNQFDKELIKELKKIND